MPLPLDDPLWDEIDGCYGGSADIRSWLESAYSKKEMSDELLGDLVNEVQHQGDSSSAMYAVAPHLVTLAQVVTPSMKLALLTNAGLIYAAAKRDGYADCPDSIEDEFRDMAQTGAALIAPLLSQATDFPELQWGVAALSGFLGYTDFARLLEHMDYYEGEFHYALLDGVIPVEP